MPPRHGRENAAKAAFPRPFGRAHARALGQGLPPGPFSLVPINTPRGLQLGDPENRVVFVALLLGIVVVIFFSSSFSFSH